MFPLAQGRAFETSDGRARLFALRHALDSRALYVPACMRDASGGACAVEQQHRPPPPRCPPAFLPLPPPLPLLTRHEPALKPQSRLDEGAIKDVSRGEEEQVCSGWQHPVPNMIQPAHCKLASYCLRNTISLYIYSCVQRPAQRPALAACAQSLHVCYLIRQCMLRVCYLIRQRMLYVCAGGKRRPVFARGCANVSSAR